MKYHLHDLTTEAFTQLCGDLLNAEFHYDKMMFFSGTKITEADIETLKGIKKSAIIVKHKLTIPENSLVSEIEKAQKKLEFFHDVFYITSAKLPPNLQEKLSTQKIKIFDYDDIINLLKKHDDISSRYFSNLKSKNRKITAALVSSISGIIVTIIFSYLSIFDKNNHSTKPLEQKIQNVEQVLIGIKSLENDLESIKDDMVETEINNKKVLAEYEKMKGVQKLVNEQKDELNAVLNYKPWTTRLLEFAFGTIFGILTSIISSILFEKWKHKLSLK